jgi:hypothetical protein
MTLLAVLGLVFVLGCILGYRQIGSPDIGFHLASARWIVENRSLPKTDIFTYTVSDHPYIDLQWLFQLMTYGLYRVGGTAPIVFATTGLTLGFAGLLLFRAWRRDGRMPLSSVLLLLLFFLATHWETRPHLLSWMWGSLVLLVLEEHGRGSRRWLPLLPAIMVLWVNTHSLFVLGLVIIATYALRVTVGTLLSRRQGGLGAVDRRLLLWSLAALAACLVNPYHVNGFLLPMTQFSDIQPGAAFTSPTTGISEFTSPFTFDAYTFHGRLVLFQPRLWYQLFTVLAVAGLIGSWRRRRPAELILFAGFLYVFWQANKNFGYFVMVCFPMAAAGLDRLGGRLRMGLAGQAHAGNQAEPRGGRRGRLAWLAAWGAVALALIPAAWTGWMYDAAWLPHRRGTGFNDAVLPVEACDFLNRNRVEGRLLNTWNDGGYVAWATGQRVFICSHGEVMGQDFYRRYVASKQPKGLPPVLTRYRPAVAIVPFQSVPYWLWHLDRAKEWRLAQADHRSAVFLHASAAPHVPAMPKPEAGADYPAYDEAEMERIVHRAAAARPPNLWESLRGRAAYPVEQIDRAGFYLQTGEVDACIGTALAGLEQTPFRVPDLLLTLGHALHGRRRYDLADPCYDAFLETERDPQIAREIAELRRRRP